MTLKERLDQDLRHAMLGHEAIRVSTIRLIKAAGQLREIEKKSPLDDSEWIEIVEREMKQRRESMEFSEKNGRADLAQKARDEMNVLELYLPAKMTENELRAAIQAVIAETGAAGPKEMGKVMSALMPKVKGRADGKLVNQLVQEALGR